ncbi:hypothetical protein N7492_002558 [Penicillium capsulatum]|uniref:DUF7603 domain-containing protein n=1 Tax=Penicillium capsulatum TaxID=69766 RepID=A0A9W9LVB0_9EURO|nr:hypothetical protein N7492_002558 [Penicillium capsulatum]KAJ6122838.1 hypothetical protein N7512_005303 [Penicillium capsulatum]
MASPPSPSSQHSSPPQIRRKPLPRHSGPVLSPDQPTSIPLDPPSPVLDGDSFVSLPRNPNRYVHCQSHRLPLFSTLSIRHGIYMLSRVPKVWKVPCRLPSSPFPRYSRGPQPAGPLRIDTSTSATFLRSVVEDEDDDDDDEDGADFFDDDYEHQFTNGIGTPLHSRLVSEPFIPVLNSPPPTQRRATSMALHPPINRPPPLHIDIDQRSMGMPDPKNPKTPGNKISSFFGWKAQTATSPGGESSSTEISDGGRSPMPSSPMPPLANVPIKPPSPGAALPQRTPSLGAGSAHDSLYMSKMSDLENELREISAELAGSIRREMELEDLIERIQIEGPEANRRTSDYFSDSGTSSVRNGPNPSQAEDIDKIRRAAEQERAQLKVELSQKLQEERIRRTQSESHVQLLENQVQQLRRERVDLSDLSSKTRELEIALEDTRRKLLEERQSKDNFEDLLTAMRVELEQLRNERDILREGKTPPAETQRLIEEIEALKIENASLAQLQGGRFASIAEEDGPGSKRHSAVGLSRSNSLARKPSGLSRSNSVTAGKERESGSGESLVDKVKDIEAQRDALHRTLRSLLTRQTCHVREWEGHQRYLETELAHAKQLGPRRRQGYEREVQSLRDDINYLRQRAEDALDGKWQCEKNLAGLKMDLDRAEQETSSLRVLLQEHNAAPEGLEADQESFAEVLATTSSLDSAYQQLQADRERASAGAQSDEVSASISRTDALAYQVRQQLETNISLRGRLESAINKGERDQQLSVERINMLQNRLKEMEDTLLVAQQHSEDEMNKHEEEIRELKECDNPHLRRKRNSAQVPGPPSAFNGRSPRLDKTTSGEGLPLAELVQAETLEKRVKDLERVLRDADSEMGEAVGRMNRAQVDVAQLQSDRDEALRQTRLLQANIQAERDSFKTLLGYA